MALTITSLTHPTMIAKIRKGMYYAHKNQGHMMNGHGNRVYIQNAQGRNIMRLNWIGGSQGFIVYGDESRDITAMVKAALGRAKVTNYATAYNAKPPKFLALAASCLLLTGCQVSGTMTAVYSVLGSLLT